MPATKLSKLLKDLAANIRLSAFQRDSRGAKRPQPKRKSCKNSPHVSTAKVLPKRSVWEYYLKRAVAQRYGENKGCIM